MASEEPKKREINYGVYSCIYRICKPRGNISDSSGCKKDRAKIAERNAGLVSTTIPFLGPVHLSYITAVYVDPRLDGDPTDKVIS